MLNELFAYIVEDTNGEFIIPTYKARGMNLPMMGSWDRVDSLVPEAEMISQSGYTIHLVRFSQAETVSVWDKWKH